MIRTLVAILIVAVVGAVLTVVLPAASFARDRMKLVEAQDRVGGRVAEMGRLVEKVCRGLADDSYDQMMRAHAQALRAEGARLSAMAGKRRSVAYFDLAEWATAGADYAEAARKLWPDGGEQRYAEWKPKVDDLRSRLFYAQAEAFDPALMASELAEIEEKRQHLRAAGAPENTVREMAEIELGLARSAAHDSPKGRAAQREAASLAKELAALEPQRPYHILDTKPYLERLRETGEAAERSVQAEIVTPRE